MQNTKRQRQIKAFLLEEIGTDRGNALFDKQEKGLDVLARGQRNKSAKQMKTLA